MKISVDCFDDHHMSATTIAAMPSPIERISCLQASQVAYLFTSNFLDELQKNIFELKQEVSDWPFLLTNETGCVKKNVLKSSNRWCPASVMLDSIDPHKLAGMLHNKKSPAG